MRVLVSAYACHPDAGSEPGAGWAWARAAALAGHEVWLLTRENNRTAVQAALEAEPRLGLHPVYFDVAWALRFKGGGKRVRSYYVLWQLKAVRVLQRLHAEVGFDLAHHVTFGIDWMPAAALEIDGVPAVWGPVGGAGAVPLRLWRWLGPRGLLQEGLRETLIRPARRVVGDRNARRARLTVVQNDDVRSRFSAGSRRVVVEPNIALPRTLGSHPLVQPRARERTAVFVGRLLAWKGARLAVAATARLPGEWQLEIYGDGPERSRLEAQAEELGVGDRVRLHGTVPRSEVLTAMARADALVLPSMHEAAGWVVGEAAALGTPVVALDHGGPATMLRAMEQEPVPVAGDVVAGLAQGVLAAAARPRVRSRRWNEDRLPALIASWYRDATQRPAGTREES